MRLASRLVFGTGSPQLACLALGCALFSAAAPLPAQQAVSTARPAVTAILPEAPLPQSAGPETSSVVEIDQASAQQQQPAPATPPTPAPNSSSTSQAPAQTPAPQSGQAQAPLTAEEQLKIQEKQRVMGVMATFNTTTDRNALPLSRKQKFQLFFKGESDPWPFALASVVAGIGMADDSYPEWGYGAQGYAKRFGAAYSDAFIGNFFGNAVLTSLLKEDPRYFQKGTGSAKKRLLWAAASTVWCRRDNGSWGPNYANVGGNLIGAAVARIYYPASERTVGDTISDGITVSVEGIVGAEVIEFWPDIARHYKRKREEKLARQAAQANSKSAAQTPAPNSPKQ